MRSRGDGMWDGGEPELVADMERSLAACVAFLNRSTCLMQAPITKQKAWWGCRFRIGKGASLDERHPRFWALAITIAAVKRPIKFWAVSISWIRSQT